MMRRYIVFLLLVAGGWSCKKYAQLPNLSSPAYLRVFNDIATYPNFLHTGQVTPFLTFLMDPVFDGKGVPENGAVVGDQLATRQLYSISYPYDEADINPPAGTPNYEYPGRAHVLVAPAINGYDLSAWAQIPSGKHRILFVVRPVSDTPFADLVDNQRSTVLIDTTVNFQAGEVYTVESVLENADLNTYGAYVRREDFIHHSFSPDSIYLSFFNLSVPTPQNASSNLSQYYNWLTDTLRIAASYYAYDFNSAGFDTIPGCGNLPQQVASRFSTQPNYYSIPFLDTSYFYDPQHNLDVYDSHDSLLCGDCYVYPQGYINIFAISGTLPYLGMQFPENSGQIYTVNFNLTPVNFNNVYPTTIQPLTNVTGNNVNWPFADNEGLPNLNLLLIGGSRYEILPSINILEAVNDRIYMMQIQKGLNQLP